MSFRKEFHLLSESECAEWNLYNLLLIQHPELIPKLLKQEITSEKTILEFESEGQDLFDYLAQNHPLEEKLVKKIFLQIVNLVERMHTLGFASGMLTLETFSCKFDVLTNELILKFADLSSFVKIDTCQPKKFSWDCFAPERILSSAITAASDIWCIGLILFQLLTNFALITADDMMTSVRQVFKIEENLTQMFQGEKYELLNGLLQSNPRNRLSLMQIRNKTWLNF